jgi:Notch-like protein
LDIYFSRSNKGGTCVDQINGYFCQCHDGKVGVNCQSTISNPCTEANLMQDLQYFELPSSEFNTYLQCTGVSTFVVNKCAENLFWHTDEQTCSAERSSVRVTGGCNLSCRNGGLCQQDPATGASFCICRLGYMGTNCELEIDNCASQPCQNNGLCISHPGGYNCICQDKIVDDCCCNGIVNPCPVSTNSAVADNFFPHLFPNRYIQCDHLGRAFVKNCAPTTKWVRFSFFIYFFATMKYYLL